LKETIADNASACREQQMMLLGKVEDETNIESEIGVTADLVGGGVEDLGSNRREI
jgi:microcompartment protein CcmK/EutM